MPVTIFCFPVTDSRIGCWDGALLRSLSWPPAWQPPTPAPGCSLTSCGTCPSERPITLQRKT